MKHIIIFFIFLLNIQISFSQENSNLEPVIQLQNQHSEVESKMEDNAKRVLAESEIKLNLEESKKKDLSGNSFIKSIMTLFILFGMMGGFFYYVKRNQSKHFGKSNTQIKILTQHYIGPKKSLAIIRVAGESMLIGITDSNINMLKSLSLLDEDIPSETPINFSEQLNNAGQFNEFKPKFNDNQVDSETKEDFSFLKVKDTVSKRLKNMRTF